MQEGKEERGNIECLGEVIKQLLNTTCSLKLFNKNTRQNSLHLPIVKQEKLPLECFPQGGFSHYFALSLSQVSFD